jgi:hypothetical protein
LSHTRLHTAVKFAFLLNLPRLFSFFSPTSLAPFSVLFLFSFSLGLRTWDRKWYLLSISPGRIYGAGTVYSAVRNQDRPFAALVRTLAT